MKVVSVAVMRDLDRRTIESGTPGFVLMDRAGTGAAEEILLFVRTNLGERHRRRFVVVAGKGNNGGDGWVVARRLHEAGERVRMVAVCPPSDLNGDALEHARLAPADLEVSVADEPPAGLLAPGDVLVDALLGTGVSGVLRPPFDAFVAWMNESRLPVMSLDVPSGLNADTGEPAGDAVIADLTLTMGLPKAGLLTPRGLRHCGELRVIDIGIPPAFVAEAPAAGDAITARDITPLLDRRASDAHKGVFGHVLVVGGSRLYPGAPILAGAAAARSGAGLVTVVVPEWTRPLIPHRPHALIVQGLPTGDTGLFDRPDVSRLRELLNKKQAVLVGPGVGPAAGIVRILEEVLQTNAPLVVDADALRIVPAVAALMRKRAPIPAVLTPHPGEMRAILEGLGAPGLLSAERAEQACFAARECGAVVVLKGRGTVVAAPDGRTAINTTGNNGLASGGSGDVLAGLTAGLLAQGYGAFDAARIAVYVHGRCAELAGCGRRALIADDLIEVLGAAWKDVTPFA